MDMRHHRRQGPEASAASLTEPGRERGDQRLHGQDQGATWTARRRTGCCCSRTRPTTTPPRSSPSAVRPPASAVPSATPCPAAAYVYQAMRVTGAADPLTPGRRDAARQAAPAQAGHHRGGRLQLLRQPDRPGHRPGGRALPPRLCGQAHGDRRGGGRRAGEPMCAASSPPPGDVVILLGGRTGRDGMRRRHRLLQGPQAGQPGDLRRRGAEGQRPRGAQAAAPVPQRGDACRLIKRCNDFGAGGVSVAIGELADGLDIDLDARAQEIRGSGRHRAGHLREPGAHGRGGGCRGRRDVHRRTPPRRTSRPRSLPRVTEEPRLRDALERQDHRGPLPRVPRTPTARPSITPTCTMPAGRLMSAAPVCVRCSPR